MSVSGLVTSPSGCCSSIHLPPRGGSRVVPGQLSAFSFVRLPMKALLLEGKCVARFTNNYYQRRTPVTKCTMDASFGDATNNSTEVFPRINVKDPYKRLGVRRDTTPLEFAAARSYLLQRYGGHKPSKDAIEKAYEQLYKEFERDKEAKFNIMQKVTDVTQSRYVQAVTNRFQIPYNKKFMVVPFVTYLLLGVLTFLFPTEEGPTLQVAISLGATIYFIYKRLKGKLQALLYGFGAFFLSWFLGTFLMVTIIPPLLKGPRSLEVSTALITYVFLWVASTCLK